LENLSEEKEWKWKNIQYHKTYSVLMYISITVIILYGLYGLAKLLVTQRKYKTLRATAAKTECLYAFLLKPVELEKLSILTLQPVMRV
jgi:hypothetical protein